MVRMPNRSETPKRVQDLEKDLQKFIASVARSFQKSADSVYQRVLDSVQAMFYTRDQSEARYAAKAHTHDAGDVVSGTLTRPVNATSVQADQHLGGTYTGTTATFSGGVSGSNGSFSTGLNSPGARNNQVTTGYVAAYLDSAGNLGYAPSTRASKDIGTEYAVDMAKFLATKIYNWQYKNGGMVGIGPIADDLEAAGLTEFLTYSMDGKLQGLRYESLTMGLWSAYVQSRTTTLAEFAKRGVQTVTDTSMTTLGINAEKTVTITWPKEWADTNYAVVPTVTSSGLALAAVAALVPGSKTTKTCKVSVRTIGIALGSTAVLTVDGIHT